MPNKIESSLQNLAFMLIEALFISAYEKQSKCPAMEK